MVKGFLKIAIPIIIIGLILGLAGSRYGHFMYVIGAILVSAVIYIIWYGINAMIKLPEFDKNMNNSGFTKRIIAYDLFSKLRQTALSTGFSGWKHWYTVGIWLNYQKQLIALRTEKDTWKEVILPFNKIKRVEIIEDGYTKTTFAGVGVGMFLVGSGSSKEVCKGLQIRIVTGDMRSGTETYSLKLYEPEYGSLNKLYKSDSIYKSIQECAASIEGELHNIVVHRQNIT